LSLLASLGQRDLDRAPVGSGDLDVRLAAAKAEAATDGIQPVPAGVASALARCGIVGDR
jgi:hypothetical protein